MKKGQRKHHAALVVFGMTLPVSVGMTSCLRMNPEHCIVLGGDRACAESGADCVVGNHAMPQDAGDGCVAGDYDKSAFVHATYGLPAAKTGADETDLDTLVGVLSALITDGCSVDEGMAQTTESWEGVRDVRVYLEESRYASGRAFLNLDHARAIWGYNDAIDAWLDGCGSENGSSLDTDTANHDTTGSGSSESDTSEADADSTSSPDECENCPNSNPFCNPITGSCVSCDEMPDSHDSCAALDSTTPICEDGSCSPCTEENAEGCGSDVCHPGLGTCLPSCAAHEDCMTGACELAEGRCFPESPIVHVDADVEADPTYASSIADALDSMVLPAGGYGIIVVHELDSGLPYVGSVAIDKGKVVALLAAPDEEPALKGSLLFDSEFSALVVSQAGTTVYVDGLSFVDGVHIGVFVDRGMAWLDRSGISKNALGDVLVRNGGSVTLRNCFVGDGGSAEAIRIAGSTATILYTTIVAGEFGAGLVCWRPLGVSVQNSIALAKGDTAVDFDCMTATVDHSVTESDITGTGNVILDASLNDLSLWFHDYEVGDLHLTQQGANVFDGIAEWQTGYPMTDIDGDPRPSGGADHPGADAP